ncbi:MAG: DUF1385 domain-containing protein [Acidimicrobiia bacterium]|nr:DUF1385 domain-containing protein [Acidimicrobiia bacterium]
MSRSPGSSVGGQAVIEGVMMRAPDAWAVAVRRPDGVIEAQRNELPRLSSRNALAKVPFLRGVFVLVESLSLGFRALSWSAERAGDDDEQVGRKEIIFTMVLAAVFAIALFILAPAFAANWIKDLVGGNGLVFVIVDGAIRIFLIVGYIWLIGRNDEIQRVFQYHGAEHKTIHAYENGDPLDVGPIQKYSPRHPRCGTSFIIIVAMVAFVVFLTLAPLPFLIQVAARIVLIPVIAGISYEILKAAAGHRRLAWASKPGMWIQAITTKEPTGDQVEVAIASLLAALTPADIEEVKERGEVNAAALSAQYDLGTNDG